MRKIVYMMFLVIITVGCSVKRIKRSATTGGSGIISNDKIFKNLEEQNITNENFFIQKAEIEIINKEETQDLIATIKFIRAEEYLVSIRNKTGIEAARAYISKDTILINDRFNRKVYYASGQYLNKKYGLTAAILPLVFGDFIDGIKKDPEDETCIDGKLSINRIVSGITINYLVDCSKGKAILATRESEYGTGGLEIKYNKFFKSGKRWIPREVEVKDFQKETIIKIKIKKISLPWEGDIEFIPGNKYEKTELL